MCVCVLVGMTNNVIFTLQNWKFIQCDFVEAFVLHFILGYCNFLNFLQLVSITLPYWEMQNSSTFRIDGI